MKNILSIDFDIIMEPSIQLYNNIQKKEWNEITNTNAYGNILIGNYETYAKIVNLIFSLSTRLPKEKIHIIYDHHHILPFLSKDENYVITNIDHHHDIMYQKENTEINCGNWVSHVPNLLKYFWIKNPNSIFPAFDDIPYTWADINTYNLNNLMTPDELFICFSEPWIPPNNQPLFYLILDMLNVIYDTHFDFVS